MRRFLIGVLAAIIAANVSDFDFYRFISARTSGDDEWLDAAWSY